MKKFIVGLLPVVVSTFGIVSAINQNDVQTLSSCNSDESHDVNYYIPTNKNVTIYPDDTYWGSLDAFIRNDSSVEIYRHWVISQCNSWERTSNIIRGGSTNPPQYPALIMRNNDGCVFSKPNYTKTNNPSAIDAQIHYTVNVNILAWSAWEEKKLNSGRFYYNDGDGNFACYPDWNWVSSNSSCASSSSYYRVDPNTHTWECLNYRVFRCGDGLVNKPIGEATRYDNGTYTEECDPAASAWKDRSDWKSCNASCKIEYEASACGSLNWTTAYNSSYSSPRITESTPGLCGVGKVVAWTLSYDKITWKYTWDCKNGEAAPASCNAQDLWCGDGTVQSTYETCDPQDTRSPSVKWWGEWTWKTCNNSCKLEDVPRTGPVCSSTYNNVTKHTDTSTAWLSSSDNLCDKWSLIPWSFSWSGTPRIFTWSCTNDWLNTNCKAYQQWCGDWVKNGNEICDPEDKINKVWRWDGCSATCDRATYDSWICGSKFHKQKVYMPIGTKRITENTQWLCDKWTVIYFTTHTSSYIYTWQCSNGWNVSDTCWADQERCGDWKVQSSEGESCDEGSDRNGTSSSLCSDMCKTVSDVACGSNDKWTTYSFSKKTTPWLTKTSDWMCAAGLTVWAPYITWSDSHLEWTCSNANGWEKICHAYQAYCGDEIVQSDKETCDEGSRNGTSSSSCSATCTTVSNAVCGSNDKKTTYFTSRQNTPWLTKTSDWMCAAWLTVSEPQIKWLDSHLEWTCSNANGWIETCNAYQEYCGDEVFQSDHEECDYNDKSETNWWNDGCDTECKQKIQVSDECNDTFHFVLRQWWQYTFRDKFIPAATRYLYDFDVKFDEQKPYDYNRWPNPDFEWADDLGDGVYKEVSTTRTVIKSTPTYPIYDHPNVRSENNLYVEYNIKYADKAYSTRPDDSKLKSHKECVFYEISRCGDGIVDTNWEWKRSEDPAEVCDPKDPNQTNWWNGWCSDTCEPIVSKWELVIKKELVWPKEIKSTWDIVKWNIRVTASWWDVTDFTITDKMPEILEYYRDSVTHNPWVTVGKATLNGNNVVWKVTWTLKKWEYVEIQLETKVKWMPTEDIENVACVKSDTQPEKCANDDVPVKWELVIKKELVWPKEVKSTWDIVKWNIRVTASWWDVTDFMITDKMPEILEYYRDSVIYNPWVTVGKATLNGNNVVWKVTWTLKKWEYVEIQLETKVKWMPTEDIENVACVKSDTQPEKCANDDVPVKWELDVVKTLISENKYVTHTWQKLEWSITVTAKNWDVKMESIRDVLPEELAYSGYKKEYIPSWITIEEPKLSNNDKEVTWKTTWTLKEWEYIELRVITTVIKMPQKTIKNVACAKPEDWKEECNPWYTHDLQIRKYVWNNQKNQWDKSMTWEVWGKITYKITFGNNGDESVFVVLKDYLPKWVRFISGTLVVWSQSSAWGISNWNLNMVYKWDTINIDGIKINTYTGVLLKPNQSWVLTIEWEILKPNSENESRTNFACIFDDKWNKIDCDDAKHNIEEKEIKCEKVDIFPSWELPNGGWEKNVTCTASDKADLITIDCWEWAIWDRYITKADTDVVSGKCSYPSWAKTYSVRCEVKNGGNPSNSCNWSVTVKGWWYSCFPAGTKVTMADGTTKNIEDVNEWDEVLSYNTDTNTNETNVVVKKFIHENNVHEMYELTINWEVLKVTNVHPFYVRKSASSKAYSWVEAQDLKVWDILLMVDGSLVTIEKINHYSNQETVYNLEVEGNHDYFVDRWYLVHNKWWCITNCDPTPYCDNHSEDAVCQFANPQCFNVNNWNVSVELWEYLPIYINLYKDDGESPDYNYMVYKPDEYPLWEDNISDMLGKECKDGDVALNSIMCKYIIKNEKTIPVYSEVHPCLDGGESVDANSLIRAWAGWQGENYGGDMQTYLEDGTPYTYSPQVYMVDTNRSDIRAKVGDRLWEYQYQVEIVDFAQCMDGKRVSKSSAGPVCQNNFVLTEPYTVQKTPAWNLTASIDTLFKFKDVSGNNPFSKHLDAIATSNYEPNTKVNDAMEAFIKKYEKLAVSIDNTTALKKVPGKNIYFVKWDIHPSNITTLNKPVTFIQTEWNTIIDWDVNYNVMVLTKWDIIFQADCTKNLNVKWIFYAAWNLKREGYKKKNNSTNNNRWCDKWWLHVKWVLIWNNFRSLMENSRSHLENWFHANDKRKEIMDWASVLIEYSPSIFTKSTMPPGAEDFTTALSIYKQ